MPSALQCWPRRPTLERDAGRPAGAAAGGKAKVLIGAPTYRGGAYALDRFLANQKEIQSRHPSSELVLATVEDDFAEELQALLGSLGIRGRVLRYETVRPSYSRSRLWNVSCGREAIRQYILSQTDAEYLLSVDHDMIFDPSIVGRLLDEIDGYGVVYSGYRVRWTDRAVCMGAGCALFTRDALRRIGFRCIEYKNGHILDDGTSLEWDLLRSGMRVKQGIFLQITHYVSENESRCIEPQPLGPFRAVTKSRLVRGAVIGSSVLLRRNVTARLLALYCRLADAGRSARRLLARE